MVQLALHKNDPRWASRVICWWTNSIYSHCELVVDGKCYSSSVVDKGVRAKDVGPGDDQISLSDDKWDLIDLPWADVERIKAYFVKTDGYSYGWWSLVTSQLFNLNRPAHESQFCSEWCASALGFDNTSSYSPETLSDQVLYLNRFETLVQPAVAA